MGDSTSEADDVSGKDWQHAYLQNMDWTQHLPSTEHVQFLKSVDWSKTHVGPIAKWPSALRQATYQLIADSRPATLYWGTEYVPIYNAAFVPLAGATHPTLMGSTFKQGFPELWQGISPLFAMAASTGIAADVLEAPMTVERNGYPEETIFTGNFTPLRDADGTIVGYYNALFEVTKLKIAERRTAVLNLIAAPSDLTTDNVCRHIISCLETNENDITMAILYQVDGEDETRNVFRLRGSIGLPKGHQLLVDDQDWINSEGLIPSCRTARTKPRPTIVPISTDERFRDIHWRGPGGPSNSIAIIKLSSGVQLLGFLIIGTNPRLLDEANAQFSEDLGRMVSGVMTSAVSVEQSRLRQVRLERDLANSDMKIQYLVQHASVGMAHLLLNGTMIWANNQYFRIVGQSPDQGQHAYGFFDNVLEDDLAAAEEEWHKVLNGHVRISAELRLKRMYIPPVGEPVPATVLLLAFPYSEEETVLSVMAVITDVSRLKWAESWQARLAKDAQEAKKQQEAFIDVVSHEMRNPLSAIIHSTDSIIACSEESRINGATPQHIEEILEAVRTIEICTKHQRHILDSVLTLGRMESALLSINPEVITIKSLLQSTLSMFRLQTQKSQISMKLKQHRSYTELDVHNVLADPARLTRILINLLTNAIKFVQDEALKDIEVEYGACTTSPPRTMFEDEMHWAPIGEFAQDASMEAGWGDDQQIYLTFKVKDSGIGVDVDQRLRIFERFKQANVKTHVFYGGSGLGLFVSKQLAERQGGEIGVYSLPGQGSTFAFYVRVRRAPESSVMELAQDTVLHTGSMPAIDALIINQEPASTDVSPIRAPEAFMEPPNPKANAHLHILLVEDNMINQQVLKKQLTRHGCTVHVANHGADALQQLTRTSCYASRAHNGIPIDVILMDTNMPVMGGTECTKEIRRLQADGTIRKHIPIIAVTANTRHELKDEVLAAGTDAIMSKPFSSKDLLAMMQEEVQKHADVSSNGMIP